MSILGLEIFLSPRANDLADTSGITWSFRKTFRTLLVLNTENPTCVLFQTPGKQFYLFVREKVVLHSDIVVSVQCRVSKVLLLMVCELLQSTLEWGVCIVSNMM